MKRVNDNSLQNLGIKIYKIIRLRLEFQSLSLRSRSIAPVKPFSRLARIILINFKHFSVYDWPYREQHSDLHNKFNHENGFSSHFFRY